MSYAADAATGQAILRGEEVVALVLDRRIGGYPDATTHAAIPGLQPCTLFEPVSLPIRGKYDAFGCIVPHPRQPSVKLMLELADKPDWKAFQDKAFGVDGGIALGDGARARRHPMFDKGETKRERVLGMAIYRKATWDLALRSSGYQDRDGDVGTVLARMAEVRAASKAGNGNDAWRNTNLLQLRQGGFHGPDGAYERLPALARALDHREGGDLIGTVAVDWLTESKGAPLGYDLMDRDPDPSLKPLLEAIWEHHAAEDGFTVLGKIWAPSSLTGRGGSMPATFALGLSMIEETGRAMVDRCEEWPESELGDKLEALLAQVDRVRETLVADLAKARADVEPEDDAASGPSP